MIDKNSIIKKNEDIISTDLDGVAVMMSIKKGRYYGMNAVATYIWENIQKPVSVDKLVSLIAEQYNVKPDQCETEVISFLTKMYGEGLLEIEEPPKEDQQN